MVFAEGGVRAATRDELRRQAERDRACIADDAVMQLAGNAIGIEDHYRRTPADDIEWAQDEIDGRLYIVQARPET